MNIRTLIIGLILLGCFPLLACAQDVSSEDIEAVRSKMLKRWGVDGLSKPSDVDAQAKKILSRPLAEQNDDDLRKLAKQANAAANFVGFILEEYQEYYRDNYRYDFIQEKVVTYHDAYVRLTNRLKAHRDQAYFNLGKKAAKRGDEVTAFFLFRDAYRLSTFTENQGDHKGMRYRAELEIKKLLGLEGIDTFIYWE